MTFTHNFITMNTVEHEYMEHSVLKLHTLPVLSFYSSLRFVTASFLAQNESEAHHLNYKPFLSRQLFAFSNRALDTKRAVLVTENSRNIILERVGTFAVFLEI